VSIENSQRVLEAFEEKEKNYIFKKIALVLHPDKNKHPQAKEAFQKSLTIFNK
jgi:DnaJ-class molecular chaperone